MSVQSRLRELLERNQATYAALPIPDPDPPAGSARKARPPARGVAVTVVIRHGGALSLAVLPANSRVDLLRLGAALRQPVELAEAGEIAATFPDCEPGAIPPFGSLYGLKTYLDESLTHERTITFRTGTLAEVMRMPFEEYRRVAVPVVLWLAESMAGA